MSSPLKQARLDSGKTLEEISSSLKIRKKYLLALEEGDFQSIPAAVYVRGYLKLYSNYLGIIITLNEEEIDEKISDDQNLRSKLKIAVFRHKWKKYLIIISILMLLIIQIMYHLILHPE